MAGFSDLANCLAIVALRIVKRAQRGRCSRRAAFSVLGLKPADTEVVPSSAFTLSAVSRLPLYLGRRVLLPHCRSINCAQPRWRIR